MIEFLAQIPQVPFERPPIDWHAVAPELVLLIGGALVTLIDLIWLDRARRWIPTLTTFVFLGAMIPIATLWESGVTREMFGGAYEIDRYSLVLKGLFLLSGYVVVLMSTNYMSEGDYYDSEFYQLLSASLLGMVVMCSARDLISMFIALELISLPAYLMATWRKRDPRSNEAGIKFFLMGVFASGILLYGMSLLYGFAGSVKLTDIGEAIAIGESKPLLTLAVVFTLMGFGFKISLVPFHTWAPDTYEGAPTPLTAFLAVASKAAGFVAVMNVAIYAFQGQSDVFEPLAWVLAAATMTIGNLIALRQTNIVRMLAYSGVAQAGYIMAPLAVYSDRVDMAVSAIITYLIIYAAMNLGAFAVVIAAARKTNSGEISSYGGMFFYAPGLTLIMTAFLFSLAGVPPLGGWWAKFELFRALLDGASPAGVTLAVIMAVNTVIAAYYYLAIAKQMWFMSAPDGDHTPIVIPSSLRIALGLTLAVVVVTGSIGIGPLSDMVQVNFANVIAAP